MSRIGYEQMLSSCIRFHVGEAVDRNPYGSPQLCYPVSIMFAPNSQYFFEFADMWDPSKIKWEEFVKRYFKNMFRCIHGNYEKIVKEE